MEESNIYNLVVRCEIDGEEKNFLFDYVEDATTNLTSDITTHPLVNGDIVADHMYLNPSSVGFGGTFSLLGNKKYDFGSTDRLANIQEIFERIMKEGIMCTLVKMSSTGDTSRFKVRENMVLTSITWVERQISMDFTFNFNEALKSVVDDVEYSLDVLDESLPLPSDPLSLDVTDELLDINEILQCTISILQEEDLFADDFLENAINWGVEMGQKLGYAAEGALAGAEIGAIVGSVSVAAAIVTMCAIFGGLASIPVGGWIAAAVIASVAIVAGIIYGIFQGLKKNKYQIKRFKYKNNEKKREAEYNRFYEFIGKIVLQFEQLEKNLSLYGFGQNTPQQCMVTIDNNYYLFTFSKSTNESNYSLEVTDINGIKVANITNIAEKAIASLNECNAETILFTTGSGVQVYLSSREILAKRQEGATNEEIEAIQKDLTKYAILSSSLDLSKFKELMADIIKSQIFK